MERESVTDVEVVISPFGFRRQQFAVDADRNVEVAIDLAGAERHFEFAAAGEVPYGGES